MPTGLWVGNKTGVTRLGFSLILKFYELEGRFPAYAEEARARISADRGPDHLSGGPP
jgi:hypothetical protein